MVYIHTYAVYIYYTSAVDTTFQLRSLRLCNSFSLCHHLRRMIVSLGCCIYLQIFLFFQLWKSPTGSLHHRCLIGSWILLRRSITSENCIWTTKNQTKTPAKFRPAAYFIVENFVWEKRRICLEIPNGNIFIGEKWQFSYLSLDKSLPRRKFFQKMFSPIRY